MVPVRSRKYAGAGIIGPLSWGAGLELKGFVNACTSDTLGVLFPGPDRPLPLLGGGWQSSHLPRRADPYYVGRDFPKLTTPQWVGEDGVDAVVVLAVDDMRDNIPKYEAFLRPILDRMKAIDGRAPVSIMTCVVDPDAWSPAVDQGRGES